MVKKGTVSIEDDWSIVLDVTDNYESKIAEISCSDADRMNNGLGEYIKSTFQINAALKVLKLDKNNTANIEAALAALMNQQDSLEIYYRVQWDTLYAAWDDDDKALVSEFADYEDSSFSKYTELLMRLRGNYQYRYHVQMIDNLSNKNNERGFMAQGRSKRHPRRFVLGTRLLETLTQINLLDTTDSHLSSKTVFY